MDKKFKENLDYCVGTASERFMEEYLEEFPENRFLNKRYFLFMEVKPLPRASFRIDLVLAEKVDEEVYLRKSQRRFFYPRDLLN